MQGPTLVELRDLSRRSRRAQAWGFGSLLGGLLLFPAQAALARWLPPDAVTMGAFAIAGALFVSYAFHVGQERGAFRRVFRRIADDARATRSLTPEAPAPLVRVELK